VRDNRRTGSLQDRQDIIGDTVRIHSKFATVDQEHAFIKMLSHRFFCYD
jgi:hypothetical protein